MPLFQNGQRPQDFGGPDIGQAAEIPPMQDFQSLTDFMPQENRDPKFRDQPNQHDAETQNIKDVLDQLDKAQKDDQRRVSMDRIRMLASKAGQAMSSQMGGLPLTETEPLPAMPSKAAGVMQKAKVKGDLEMDLFKRENPDLERKNKYDIEELRGLVNGQIADKREKGQDARMDKRLKQQAALDYFNQGKQDARTNATNQTTLDAAGVKEAGQGSARVGEKAAAEEYSQSAMDHKQTHNGRQFHADGTVTNNMSGEADKIAKNYSALAIDMDAAIAAITKDPLAVKETGTDARRTAEAWIQKAANDIVKYQENGVANGQDIPHALTILGSPETWETAIFGNGGQALQAMRQGLDRDLTGRMKSAGYSEGPGKSAKLDDVHARAAAAARKASSGGTGQIVAPNAPVVPGSKRPERGQSIGPAVPGTQPYDPNARNFSSPGDQPQKPRSIVIGPNGQPTWGN